MDLLYATVTLLVALSLATERLVEIVKGLIPALNTDQGAHDSRRRLLIHLLTVGAGALTAWLAKGAIPEQLKADGLGYLGLGLLASGGSSFWNSILTYLLKVKDIKEADATQRRMEVRAMAASDPKALRELERGT